MISWPAFLGRIAGLCLVIQLLLDGLYRLDRAGIGGAAGPRASFALAVFFSVQTLGSIGDGVRHPPGLYAHGVVALELPSGLLDMSLTTGLVFARSTARIRVPELAVVHPDNGVATLCFRLANERRNTSRDARLHAFLAFDETKRGGASPAPAETPPPAARSGRGRPAGVDGDAPSGCLQPPAGS